MKFILLVFQFFFCSSVFSQNIIKLAGVKHVYGMLNDSVILCDTADVQIDSETSEIKLPEFVIKNLSSGKKHVLMHEGKKVSSNSVHVIGQFIIVEYGADQGYRKYITKLNQQGEIVKEFGINGFAVVHSVENERDIVDIVSDSIGDFYIARERSVDGLSQFALYRYLANGTLDLAFGNKGCLISDATSGFYSINKLWLFNNKVIVVCTENTPDKERVVFSISGKDNNIQKREAHFKRVIMLRHPAGDLLFDVRGNEIDIYDHNFLLKSTIKNVESAAVTEILYNAANRKCYIFTDGMNKHVSRVYQLQSDLTVKLFFSSDTYNSFASYKDDHITGIYFSKEYVSVILSVTEHPAKYTYVNYLFQIK